MILIIIFLLQLNDITFNNQELIFDRDYSILTGNQNLYLFRDTNDNYIYIVVPRQCDQINLNTDTLIQDQKYIINLDVYPIGSRLEVYREFGLMSPDGIIITEGDTTNIIMYTTQNIQGKYYIPSEKLDSTKIE